MNMNAKLLVLGTAMITLTGTLFASDALLSPRAQGNQIKVVAAATQTPAVTVAYVSTVTPASARVQAAQIKVVKGVFTDSNPALECRRTMLGTPKAVTACSQSVTMPGCQKLVAAK